MFILYLVTLLNSLLSCKFCGFLRIFYINISAYRDCYMPSFLIYIPFFCLIELVRTSSTVMVNFLNWFLILMGKYCCLPLSIMLVVGFCRCSEVIFLRVFFFNIMNGCWILSAAFSPLINLIRFRFFFFFFNSGRLYWLIRGY